MALYENSPQMMVLAVRRWQDPFVGHSDGSPTLTDRARGTQWRLVVAMAAWECFSKKHWPRKRPTDCYRRAQWPLASAIAPPNSSSLRSWMDSTQPDLLQAYFSLHPPSWRLVSAWLHGSAVEEHVSAMNLAWGLRNAAVHGRLSATKASEWDLLAAHEQLTDHVCAVIENASINRPA